MTDLLATGSGNKDSPNFSANSVGAETLESLAVNVYLEFLADNG